MKNKKVIASIFLALSLATVTSSTGMFAAENSNDEEKEVHDYGPIVYIEDESELPENYRKMMEEYRNAPYITLTPEEAKEKAFRDSIKRKSVRNGDAAADENDEWDLNFKEGILICGTSKGCDVDGSKLPKYPDFNVTHWIVADGHSWDSSTQTTDKIAFIDSLKSDAVNWGSSVETHSRIVPERVYRYAFSR